MSSLSTEPRVYLAGPGVFRPDAKAFGEMLRAKCARAGLVGCFPLDNEIESASPHKISKAIYLANVALIDSARAVIADISPFRGPNMDPGTAWEVGYAVAKGLPVYAWTAADSDLLSRTRRHMGASAAEQSLVDHDGNTIENFGHTENLMIALACASIYDNADAAIAACAAALRGPGT